MEYAKRAGLNVLFVTMIGGGEWGLAYPLGAAPCPGKRGIVPQIVDPFIGFAVFKLFFEEAVEPPPGDECEAGRLVGVRVAAPITLDLVEVEGGVQVISDRFTIQNVLDPIEGMEAEFCYVSDPFTGGAVGMDCPAVTDNILMIDEATIQANVARLNVPRMGGGLILIDIIIDQQSSVGGISDGIAISVTPEPATWCLLAIGFVGLLGYRWHQRRRTPWASTVRGIPVVDGHHGTGKVANRRREVATT
jgi:hypothetical protein